VRRREIEEESNQRRRRRISSVHFQFSPTTNHLPEGSEKIHEGSPHLLTRISVQTQVKLIKPSRFLFQSFIEGSQTQINGETK
jgi:hypothetical protein